MNSAELWQAQIDHKNNLGIAFQHASDRLCAFPTTSNESNVSVSIAIAISGIGNNISVFVESRLCLYLYQFS